MIAKISYIVSMVLLLTSSSAAQQSVLGLALDLLPELQELLAEPSPYVDYGSIPTADPQQIETAGQLFKLVMPTIKQLMEVRSQKQFNRPLDEATKKTLDRMERLLPKVIKLVGTIATLPAVGPEVEPLIADHTGSVQLKSLLDLRTPASSFSQSTAQLQQISQGHASVKQNTPLSNEVPIKYDAINSNQQSSNQQIIPKPVQFLSKQHIQSAPAAVFKPTFHGQTDNVQGSQFTLQAYGDRSAAVTQYQMKRPNAEFGVNPFLADPNSTPSHAFFYNLPGGGYVYNERYY